MTDLSRLALAAPDVALVHRPSATYGAVPPFNPHEGYPEYPFAGNDLSAGNPAYDAVREALRMTEWDQEAFGTRSWNPLGLFVSPNQRVLVKPNAVMDFNMNRQESVWAVITHPSVIRAVVDYVFVALGGKGEIVIADAPMAQCDFARWMQITAFQSIVDLYAKQFGFKIEVLDLRRSAAPFDWGKGIARASDRRTLAGDPKGYAEVDLGGNSEFASWDERRIRRIYGSDYDTSFTVNNHLHGCHKYLISKSVLESDVVVHIPKMKTHGKVGVTVNLKGMVGVVGDKNYIPHQCVGPVSYGGDETARFGVVADFLNYMRTILITHVLRHQTPFAERLYLRLEVARKTAERCCRRLGVIPARIPTGGIYGAWHGNDTAWRMALDLTRIVLFADSCGRLAGVQQRKFVSIVDGIVAGEGDGPLMPKARDCGVIIAGANPLWVDAVAASLMGFRVERVRMLVEALGREWFAQGRSLESVRLKSNSERYPNMRALLLDKGLAFTPPLCWMGYVTK